MRTQNKKRNIFNSILLMILSFVVFTIYGTFGVIYANCKYILSGDWKGLYYYWEGIFYKLAVSFDQIGNILTGELNNDYLITHDGHLYGDEDETVSEATGINEINDTLTDAGKRFNAMLTFILGVGHARNSVEKKDD